MARPDPRDRIVDAAVARLHERGLTVALDGISLEEAIADSGVPRATAYRRWPNRAEFTRAVLIRAVRSARLEPESPDDAQFQSLLDEQHGTLETDAERRTALVETLRQATDADHRRLAASGAWRDYLALRVTCNGLPDDELRHTLSHELREVEREFAGRRDRLYAQVPQRFGYRFVTPLDEEDGFTLIAEIAGSLMTGLVLDTDATDPPTTFRAAAFGSDIEAEWTTASYALTATLLAHLEIVAPGG